MTPREVEEYRALRATIRERGTARVWVMVVGFLGWAALVVATPTLVLPLATFLPLLVLAAVFEAVLSLHTGVERIGRYLQVYFEAGPDDAGWEHRVMQFGAEFPGGASDPLFCVYFWSATVINLIPALLAAPVPVEWAVVGTLHAAFLVRVGAARRASRRQRAIDLERFTQIKQREGKPAAG